MPAEKKTAPDRGGLLNIGPGFVMAATGLGAGDLIAATVAGVRYDSALLWAVVIGAVLKGALNEALARWQLATGLTLLEGWQVYLPRPVRWLFTAYLFLWSFLVAAALMAACGLAAFTLWPVLSLEAWAGLHSLLAVILVLAGRYRLLENLMKLFIGLMFITVLAAVINLDADWARVAGGFIPSLPDGSFRLVLGVIGGVGGSVTLLCYGYWINEKGWQGPAYIRGMRFDLVGAYSLTALFGVCILVLAAHSKPAGEGGSAILVALAARLDSLLGETYGRLFLFGFWGAVFSSMLGVWQGVPSLYADLFTGRTRKPGRHYLAFLLFMATLPFSLLFYEKPVWLAVTYAVAGSFFMPFLAATLLYLVNEVRLVNRYKNGAASNLLLALALVLFGVLFIFRFF